MSSKAPPGNDGVQQDNIGQSLETMRALATVLLVSYHVILGLKLDGQHPLQLFADVLIDLRMPLFAFIAGYVYAIRPALMGRYNGFILGKCRRLLLPGAVAVTLFAAFSRLVANPFSVHLNELWVIYFLPYAHFWFLQAIFVIFIVYGLVDVLTKRRYDLWLFALSFAIYLTGLAFPSEIFSVNAAIYLLPFFLLGVIVNRHRSVMARYWLWIAVLGLLGVLASTAWNVQILFETGSFSSVKRDLQSIVFGLSACILLLIVLPRISAFEVLGPLSFTIYLYHVIFASMMRRSLYYIGIQDEFLHLVLGVVAGVAFPALMHLGLSHWDRLSQYVLGVRQRRPSSKPLRIAEATEHR